MAGGRQYDDEDLCSFYEEPVDQEPSMETLLENMTVTGVQYQQFPPPTTSHVHVQPPHPVATGPHLQPVHQPPSMLHVQHPPAMPVQYQQQAPSAINLQYPQPPPATMPLVQHQEMLGELSAMSFQHQHMLQGQWPVPAMPLIQHQPTQGESTAADDDQMIQQMLDEMPSPPMPLQRHHQILAGESSSSSSSMMPRQQHQLMLGVPPSSSSSTMPVLHHLQMPGDGHQDEYYFRPPSPDCNSPSLQQIFNEQGDYGLGALFMEMEKEDEEAANLHAGDVSHMANDEIAFVQFVPGQLECSHCYVVREVRHHSESQVQFFYVHAAAEDETFTHAIVDRNYTGADGQAPRAERLYIDLRRRSHEWVRRFVADAVETLRNEAGTLDDVHDALGAEAVPSSSSIAVDAPPPASDAHIPGSIFSTGAAVNPAAMVQPPPQPPPPQAAAPPLPPVPRVPLWHGAPPQILESAYVPPPDPANATEYPSSISRRQGERPAASASAEEEETRQHVRAAREDAQREESAPADALKKFCRGNPHYSHLLRHIRGINKRIVELDRAARRFVGSELTKIRRMVDQIVAEKRNYYAELAKGMNKEREKKERDFPPGRNDDEAGPSGGAGGAGAGPSCGGAGGGAGPSGGCALVS